MIDQNNDDIKDIEMSLRKALASEKQTGLTGSQLNSLHLMITKEQFKKTKARPAWKNWLVPSSILATAMVAFIVFDRFPNSESNSVRTETAAPWVEAETPVASRPETSEQKPKVAQKKDEAPKLPPPAAAPMVAELEEANDGAVNRAGPKQKRNIAKPEIAKNTAKKATKEKAWESKGSAAKDSPPSPQGVGGGASSFGSMADYKAESSPGAGRSLGMSLKKSESKVAMQSVTLLQVSKVSTETSKRITTALGNLSVCDSTASTWDVSFEVSKSGQILSPKAIRESGTSVQSKCIVDKIKKWNLGSTSTGLIKMKIKFSAK